MKLKIIVWMILCLSVVGCVSSDKEAPKNTETRTNNTTKTAESPETGKNTDNKADNKPESNTAEVKTKSNKTETTTAKNSCGELKRDGMKLVAKQTFSLDFEPYQGACFATFNDPEYSDPPLDSEFFIYDNGKEVFEFPEQFNGVESGCWVDAVGFEDLNGDGDKDIIVVGKCSAKSAPYNENMVYVNRGDKFTTSQEANYELADFTKVKEISDFVKKNKQLFY
jgi:hypothetical protein